MDRAELKLVRNWNFPRIQDLGSSKHLTNNKQHILQQYHWIIDSFFSKTKLNSHYEAILNIQTVSNRKKIKSRFLCIYLLLMEEYLKNPIWFGNEPTVVTCKSLIYWQIHCIRKYRGLIKYTDRLDNTLPLPSGNNPAYDLDRKKLFLLVEKYHNSLFSLADKIIINK
jgi:hypothetical protein